MSNVLVTGGNGQLGSEIKDLTNKYPQNTFYFTDSKELDITNHTSVKDFIRANTIDVIVNCAAYTAVDNAETEPELSDEINHLAVRNFAELAKEANLKLIHISTDYVFDGTAHKPYLETDKTNPQSVYGRTKLSGENAVIEIAPKNSIIIRTSWVYSNYGNNFVKSMIRLGKERSELGIIFDQVGTPTYAGDLAETILDILPKIKNEFVEVYHYSNEGVCSWYDFSQAIFEISKIEVKVNPIGTKEYPTPAKRPSYSLLNKNKIKENYNLEIPYWRDSLYNCLNK